MSDGPAFPNGLRVTVAGRLGTVRFCGGTTFAAGVWVGVELDDAVGKNSGTVQDVEYFRCPPEHGIFVRPPMVQALEGDAARPSVLSRGGEAPSRASVASASTSGASEQAKAAASVAASAAAPAPTLAADTAHEKKQEGAKPEDAAAKKAAAEKTAAEKAAADKVAAEKAAADKVAAEKAAAEKVAAEKAAAEKVAAEKAAAEKAAAEKDAADKAAADKAAANKAAADKAAADKAAADKAAAEKAAAAAEQAEKAARDQAKRAQEASAEQLAASKAQASAEADLRGARQEVTRLKNDIERARASTSTERERLSQLKWRREQALQKMEKLAKMDYGVIEQSEEVQQAQAEMKRAAEAAEKLRSELNQKKNNVSTMMMIRSKLKKKVGDVQDQSQLQGVLQEKLEAAVLARLLAEERLEELRLELAEAELKRDEEAQERFRLLVQIAAAPTPSHEPQGEDSAMAALMKLQNRKNRNDTPAAPAEVEETPAQKVAAITRSPNLDAYQEALRVLHDASQHEVSQLQKQIAELDQDSNKVPRLKNDQKALTNRQNLLQERMADLDTETLALAETAKAGEELLDLRDSVVHELRQEVERREERLGKLEDLVLKLDKDRRRLMEEAERDALDAKQLREEVVRLMDGNLQGERTSAEQVHSRLAVATVQRSLARLDLATAQAKANAFADCVPKTWVVEEATGPAATLSLAFARGTCAQAAEGLLFRLEVLGRRSAQESHRPPCRLELCEVASASFRTAAALASALDGGLCEASVEAAKALEAQFRRVEPKLKEVMSRKTLDSPSQVLSCLQDLEALTQQLPKSQSRRVVGLQLQRFQVAFAYGAASASEPVTAGESTTPVELAKEAPEDSAMAALMRLQNRKKKKEEEPTMPSADADAADVENSATETAQAAESAAGVPVEVEQFHEEQWAELAQRLQVLQHAVEPKNWPGGPELQRIGKAIEVGLSRCSTGGEEPLSFWRALKTASEFWETLLPSLEKRAPLAKGAEELSLSSARVSATLPAWADSSLEVQSRIEEIDEKQREVRDANQRLKEKQKELALAEEEMQKAEGRARDLKTQLSAMLQANQTSEALQAEEEELRQTVALKAKQQANLAQQLHEAKAKRDHLEELHQDEEKKRAKLEESIDKMRQRPKQDEDGRATAPELAALRLAQKKGARELYRLQVAGMEELLPFPSQKETSHKDEALEKYILLRKSLLKHLSGTRIHRLGVHHTDAEASLRVQELHLQWSEARSTQKLDAEVKSGSPHGGAAGLGAEKVLKMSLTLQSPRWASTKVEKDLHTSSWSEIREIHQATNPVLSASK